MNPIAQVTSDKWRVPQVWRGPRPKQVDYPTIARQFKTIISLEGTYEDAIEEAAMPDVHFIEWPISVWEIEFKGISQGEVEKTLDLIQAAEKPLLVHCEYGEDRTGLVIAAFRVRFCSWSKESAWSETKDFGYRGWPFNHGLNKTWKGFQ
jgi:protein tyrosine/serine phosphatase